MTTRLLNVQSLLWLALVLALAGSLRHLAAVFATIDGDHLFGWLQAIAIDAGLFALAYSLKVRKVAKRSTRILWLGVMMFTGISIYGNYAYGLLATSGSLAGWIVATKPLILAASLPVLVLYLAELVSDDHQHAAAMAAKEAKKQRISSDKLAEINAEKVATKERNLARLRDLLTTKPEATVTELATALGVSRATVRNYRQELNGGMQ